MPVFMVAEPQCVVGGKPFAPHIVPVRLGDCVAEPLVSDLMNDDELPASGSLSGHGSLRIGDGGGGLHPAARGVGDDVCQLVEDDRIPYKLQPGNPNYELSYGASGIADYLLACRFDRAASSAA